MAAPTDVSSMRRAIRLAMRARRRTAPNPRVGAVVVRDGEVVGEGWHEGPGTDHAEVVALRAAGPGARGATLYVTLAPCTQHGRTPPCLPAVVGSGVSRVVVGALDPSPPEQPGSVPALREAGIEVTQGVAARDAARLIEGFTSLVALGRPFVTLKLASTLDGRVAAADGSSRWITGEQARRDAHRLRASSDAVLVGVGTVIADDPELTCRLPGFAGAQPLAVVLDSAGRTPVDATVLRRLGGCLAAVTDKASEEAVSRLAASGAQVVRIADRDGRVDASALLALLGERGFTDVLAEGGPALAGDLLERGLVDRMVVYLAPKLLGHLGAPAIGGLVVPSIEQARGLRIVSVRRVGDDVRVEATPEG